MVSLYRFYSSCFRSSARALSLSFSLYLSLSLSLLYLSLSLSISLSSDSQDEPLEGKAGRPRRFAMQVGCGESWGDRIGGQGTEDIPDVADDGDDDQVETEGLAAFVVERPKAVHGDDGAACVVCLKCSSQGTAALGARVVGTGDGSGDGTPEGDRAGTDEGGTDVAAPQMWTAGEMMMHPDRLLGALEVVSRSATALGVERSLAIHQAIVAGDTMHPKVA